MCLYTDASNRWDVQQNTNTHTHSERETAYTLGSLASILGPFFLLLTWHVRDLAAADPAGGRVKKMSSIILFDRNSQVDRVDSEKGWKWWFPKEKRKKRTQKRGGEVKSCHTCLLDFTSKMWKKIQFWGRRMCKVLLWYSNIELFRFLFNVTIQRSDWLLWNN